LLKEPISALFVRRTTVKILYLLALLIVAIAASACNTTRGFGQDVEATGEAIERTADDAMDDDE
jgi:entericidin B